MATAGTAIAEVEVETRVINIVIRGQIAERKKENLEARLADQLNCFAPCTVTFEYASFIYDCDGETVIYLTDYSLSDGGKTLGGYTTSYCESQRRLATGDTEVAEPEVMTDVASTTKVPTSDADAVAAVSAGTSAVAASSAAGLGAILNVTVDSIDPTVSTSVTTVTMVVAPPPPGGSSGLGDGTIAGIAIGVAAVVTLLVIAACWWKRKSAGVVAVVTLLGKSAKVKPWAPTTRVVNAGHSPSRSRTSPSCSRTTAA